MSFRIGSKNPATMGALRNSAQNRADEKKAMEKLSSGKRINRAADDAAGLAIAEQMSAVIKGLEQGMENVYDGLSMVETADASLEGTTDNLHRMRELAIGAANETLSPVQRDTMQAEFDSLSSEISRIADGTEFNGQKMLDGSAGEVEIALGQSTDGSPETLTMDFSRKMDAEALGLSATQLVGDDGSNARSAIAEIDAALAVVSEQRAEFGGVSNRMMSANQGLAVAAENTYASRSRVMDADYAKETAELTRKQILSKAGDAVLVQGRLMPSSVMDLLKS